MRLKYRIGHTNSRDIAKNPAAKWNGAALMGNIG